MVLDDFGFGIGLVWIIGSSLLVSSFVLCGATTLVICGTTTIVLYGTYHPLWLCFSLIGWFSLWLGFGLSSGDIYDLCQDCETVFWVERFTRSIPPVNELIFWLGL
jgi:hypothetical protein